MRSITTYLLGALVLFSACKKGKEDSNTAPPAKLVSYSAPSTGSAALAIPNDEADDGQWTRPAKDYASTRYSKLDQINARNVGGLRVSGPRSRAVVGDL